MTTYTIELAQATDHRLAELHDEAQRVSSRYHQAADAIHAYVGDQRERDRRGLRQGDWQLTLEQCLTMPAERPWCAEGLAINRKVLADCREQLAALHAAIRVEDEVYAQHRWPRFFLVVSSDGHIHRTMSCSTCLPRTRFGWLPDLSGLDEAAAVAAHGAKLCTVCYPSAPVEWTNAFELAREARKASECPASRTVAQRRFGYTRCPKCGKGYRPTRNGYIPAHKARA